MGKTKIRELKHKSIFGMLDDELAKKDTPLEEAVKGKQKKIPFNALEE